MTAGYQCPDAVEHIDEHECENAAEKAPLQGADDIELEGDGTDIKA